MKNTGFNKLLQTKMTRKNFILFSSSLLLTVVGITQLGETIRNTLQKHNSNYITNFPSTGFSEGPYGGKKRA